MIMNTITFNDLTIPVDSYNKSTYFDGDNITSTASCNIIPSDMTALNAVAVAGITAIQIHHNDTLIYDLQNISAHINNISEYLNDDRVNVTVSLTFDNE